MGVLAALVRRAQTGGRLRRGRLAVSRRAWPGSRTLRELPRLRPVPERHRTGSNRVVPFQAFETKTGPLIVAAGNDRLFVKLAGALGHPEWVKDRASRPTPSAWSTRPSCAP